MRGMIAGLVTLITLIGGCRGVCRVSNGQQCVFPFTHKNITYAGCTNEKDPDGRYWCSTEVTSQGEHVGGKKAWGHCSDNCPRAEDRLYPDCRALVVTDKDEDFSSGEYVVDSSRVVLGRAVYVNKEKELFMFRLPKNAGWGIGYESGLSSGGSFYSSGPDIQDEPWLGAWAEQNLKVSCKEDLPFISSVTTLQQTTRTCSDREFCVVRQHCPAVERYYQQLLGKRKGDPNSMAVAKMLKEKVCNAREKGFCCEEEDDSVCSGGESCRTVESCIANKRRVDRIRGDRVGFREASRLYRELKGRVCDSRGKMFCCDGK